MAKPSPRNGEKYFLRRLRALKMGTLELCQNNARVQKQYSKIKQASRGFKGGKILSSPSELWPVVTRLSVSESLFLFPPAAGPLPQSSSANRGIRHKCSMP